MVDVLIPSNNHVSLWTMTIFRSTMTRFLQAVLVAPKCSSPVGTHNHAFAVHNATQATTLILHNGTFHLLYSCFQ